ncbi:DUF4157 domain-containing protein [Halomonas urumqiensis]|nr:DUF4157 domain-containing protein [Halomonas urumqiensis]GHE20359.1 hypothetical protein GCM10017767_08800 [Halomonas urumqiensis]
MKLWQARKGHRTGKRGPGKPSFAHGIHHQAQPVGQVLYGEPAEVHIRDSSGPVVQTKLVQTKLVQAKLNVGAPDDRFEQEADWMADRVTEGASADKAIHTTNTDVAQRLCEECEEEEQQEVNVQAKAESATIAPSQASGLPPANGGQPMPRPLQQRFSKGFGRDLGPVRIHTHSQADEQARRLNAQAYTYGQHIYFRQGHYQPDTRRGQWLLAHELTHTLQQDSHKQLKPLNESEGQANTEQLGERSDGSGGSP